MANNNVQNVRFLRNGNLFESRAVARAELENKQTGFTLAQDGSIILARYLADNHVVKTLAGFVFVDSTETTKAITIFDIDDVGSDVQKAIDEINAKIGTGVTSANTVTAQLKALSGNAQSTSAETSVAGAKKYAEDLISTLDVSDTAVEGSYVSQVSEADGKISVSRVALPDASSVSGDSKVVIDVTQNKGAITATASNLTGVKLDGLTAGTDTKIAATDTLGEALANIQGQIDAMDKSADAVDGQVVTTVAEADGKVTETKANVKDLQLGGYAKTNDTGDILSADTVNVALSKLENKAAAITIGNADGSINVTTGASGTDINVNIKSGEKVLAKDGNAGLYTDIDLVKITTGLPETIKERYQLLATDDSQIGTNIDIPKDSHIVSINYITTGEHAQNLEYVYIDASGATQTTYVDMSELVLEAEFASGVTVTDHVAHGVVDSASEKDENNVAFLTVGADGFKVSGIKDAIDTKINKLDVTGDTAVAGQYVAAIEETDGIVAVKTRANVSEAVLNNYAKGSDSGAVITSDTINAAISKLENQVGASNDLVKELSGKTFTVATSSNDSITTATTAATDGTVSVDLITDASKIKMSGFTAAESGFTTIAQSSSVTEAFKAVEAFVLDNEEVVSNALNDLNTRINEVDGDLDSEIAARKAVDGQTGQTYAANASSPYISGATSLNDADVKLAAELKTLDDKAIKSVSVNNKTLAETSGAVAINISSAAGTGATEEAIVVNTANNGDVTLQINYIDAGTY